MFLQARRLRFSAWTTSYSGFDFFRRLVFWCSESSAPTVVVRQLFRYRPALRLLSWLWCLCCCLCSAHATFRRLFPLLVLRLSVAAVCCLDLTVVCEVSAPPHLMIPVAPERQARPLDGVGIVVVVVRGCSCCCERHESTRARVVYSQQSTPHEANQLALQLALRYDP